MSRTTLPFGDSQLRLAAAFDVDKQTMICFIKTKVWRKVRMKSAVRKR